MEEATGDVIGVTKVIIPRKTDLNAMHKYLVKIVLVVQWNVHSESTSLIENKIPSLNVLLPIHVQQKERASSKTISSYVSFERIEELFNTTGKFMVIGKIEFFLAHGCTRLNKLDHLAYVHCFPGCEYDTSAGMWKARNSENAK